MSNGNGHGTNGTNGNGNGFLSPAMRATGMEAVGLGVAEFASAGVSLGVVAVADKVAPEALKHTSKILGKILEPYLETIENGMQKVCKLEECKPDYKLSREQRSENLAKLLTIFNAAFWASFAVKLGTRCGMNSMMGLNKNVVKSGNWFMDYIMPKKHDLHIVLWDESIHIGSMLFLNTIGAKQTDHLLHASTGMLKNLGFQEDKAKAIASMGVIWELPNLLGWLAGVGKIAHENFRKPGL